MFLSEIIISCLIGVTFLYRKAAELKSLLNVRGGTMSVAALRLTDTAVILLCLDMAATYLSQPFDKVRNRI